MMPTIGALRELACIELHRRALPICLSRLLLAEEKRGLEDQARHLFGCT
jgi:hypothetical protein